MTERDTYYLGLLVRLREILTEATLERSWPDVYRTIGIIESMITQRTEQEKREGEA